MRILMKTQVKRRSIPMKMMINKGLHALTMSMTTILMMRMMLTKMKDCVQCMWTG